jgi:hypothetical protein
MAKPRAGRTFCLKNHKISFLMNNITFKFTILLLTGGIALSSLTSCNLGKSGKFQSTGTVNELLVITNDKEQWEGPPGDTIRAFFADEQIGLSQPEPVFDLVNIADENFNDIFKKFHNIFIVDINPDSSQTISGTYKDLWSEPQRIIKITAPDAQSFYKEFDLKKDTFMKLFIELERERTLHINKMATDIQLSEIVAKKFGIKLPIPEGFYLAKESKDFMWLRHKVTKVKQDLELGIMIYTMDYQDTIVFDPRHIIRWRNTITLEHIPGSADNSFMKVAAENVRPVFDTITDFPGGYAVETRGLWEVENDFMGGPFINYTFIDKATSKVITIDAYIYNPNDVKKYYLRELESIFFALKFTPR